MSQFSSRNYYVERGILEKITTVGRLKEILKDIPDDFIVETEGCDCTGPCNGVSINAEDKTICIDRLQGY